MMEPLMVDQSIAEKLRKIAQEGNRTVDDVLSEWIEEHETTEAREPEPDFDSDAMVRKVRLHAYEEARRYWRETGNTERLALTDEQLDEQFWLFDPDGVPRLKSEMDQVEIPAGSLYRLGEALRKAGFNSGRKDTGLRTKDILRTEFADHIRRRTHKRDQHGK